jgi:competence protein ComEC
VQQRLGPFGPVDVSRPLVGWRFQAGLAAMLERERARWMLWLPVCLAAGIVLFFNLPGEPPSWCGWLAAALGVAGAAAAGSGWRGGAGVREALLLALTAASSGFALGQARLHAVAAPILAREGVYAVEGRVVDLAPLPSGERLLLDRVTLGEVAPEATPATIRVNLRRAPADLVPGDRVRLRARLQRPLPPPLPGAFDFARQAWFDGLGAMGFALGPAERLPGKQTGWALAIAALRAAIARRIAEENPGPAGAMAAALVAGVRAGIDQATWRAMQISGLAHILSVSGLHMVLVAGSVFAACRWLLALCPPLALRMPVKKIAAVVAVMAAAFYLVLSGATVPTQRSFLMTAVALFAVIVDRNPFSLRLLAWSALVVVVLLPESVLGVSFQLSFGAVLALMVVYETWHARARRDEKPKPGPLGAVWAYLVGVSVTTLVASAATTPLAAFHFQTIPTYGVLANLLAVPLTSFLVMPAGMIGLLLMPLGLEGPFFHVMTWGCEGVLATARIVAGLPGASVLVTQWPGSGLALLAFGGLWLALWQQPWRWLGLVPCTTALALIALSRPPDILIDRGLDMAAVRGADGQVMLLAWSRDRLIRDSWLRSLGVAAPVAAAEPGKGSLRGVTCDEVGCVVEVGGLHVGLAHDVEAAVEDCGRVDLVVARAGPEFCSGGRVVKPRALRASGGIAITRRDGRLEVRTVKASRGDWPWTRTSTGVKTYKLKSGE